jgi:DNA-binding transcriptional regulator YiaG
VSDRANLSDRDAERLRALLARRRALEASCTAAADELARATKEICDRGGVSRGEVAAALGVGASTVQGWVRRGRLLD